MNGVMNGQGVKVLSIALAFCHYIQRICSSA
jgi:hypothetical protein